jgi:hypothetical protein
MIKKRVQEDDGESEKEQTKKRQKVKFTALMGATAQLATDCTSEYS